MDPENLTLNLGSQAVVALTILTLSRYTLPALGRIQATPHSAAKHSGGGRIWHALRQRWQEVTGNAG